MKRVSAEGLREKRPDDPLTRAEWNAAVRALQAAGSGLGAAGDGGRLHQPVAQRAVSREVSAVTAGGDIPRWSILQLSAIASGDQYDPIFGAAYATDLDGVLATNGDSEVPASGGNQPYRVIVIQHGDVLRLRVTETVGDQPSPSDRASPATGGVLEEDPDGEFVCLSAVWTETESGPVAWFAYRPSVADPVTPKTGGAIRVNLVFESDITEGEATRIFESTDSGDFSPHGIDIFSDGSIEFVEPGAFLLIAQMIAQASTDEAVQGLANFDIQLFQSSSWTGITRSEWGSIVSIDSTERTILQTVTVAATYRWTQSDINAGKRARVRGRAQGPAGFKFSAGGGVAVTWIP
jgi:hypothetical protein